MPPRLPGGRGLGGWGARRGRGGHAVGWRGDGGRGGRGGGSLGARRRAVVEWDRGSPAAPSSRGRFLFISCGVWVWAVCTVVGAPSSELSFFPFPASVSLAVEREEASRRGVRGSVWILLRGRRRSWHGARMGGGGGAVF